MRWTGRPLLRSRSGRSQRDPGSYRSDVPLASRSLLFFFTKGRSSSALSTKRCLTFRRESARSDRKSKGFCGCSSNRMHRLLSLTVCRKQAASNSLLIRLLRQRQAVVSRACRIFELIKRVETWINSPWSKTGRQAVAQSD